MPGEGGGRDWSDASTSQRMPSVDGCPQTLGVKHETDPPSEPSEGTDPADNLIWAF